MLQTSHYRGMLERRIQIPAIWVTVDSVDSVDLVDTVDSVDTVDTVDTEVSPMEEVVLRLLTPVPSAPHSEAHLSRAQRPGKYSLFVNCRYPIKIYLLEIRSNYFSNITTIYIRILYIVFSHCRGYGYGR